MSKAFTKDDDNAPAPPLVSHRASLPEGVFNYVTARGLALLQRELAELEVEAEPLRTRPADDPDRRRGLESLARRRSELEARIASAVLVPPPAAGVDEVRFGAQVTVRTSAGAERRYEIVGVDEADAAAGRIAFVAPLARALLGRRAGDLVVLRTPRGEEELEIVLVSYRE